jgi:hypothetical protein
MRAVRLLSVLVFALLAGLACGSDGGGGGGGAPVTLTGTVVDYWSDQPVAGALVAGGGQVGSTTADGSGNFTFDDVPRNSGVQFTTSLTGYRNTRNESIAVGTDPVTADVFIAATADVARQYTAVGVTEVAGRMMVIIELEEQGTPREGNLLAEMELVDDQGDPTGQGPYVFGAGGDIVPNATLSQSTAFNGRSRIAFLNVPAGRVTFRLTIPPPNPGLLILPLTGTTNGVVLGRR